LKEQGDNSREFNVLTPVSQRPIPQSASEHVLSNDFTLLCIRLPLVDEFEKAIKTISKKTKALKKSLEPLAVTALAHLTTWLPPALNYIVTQSVFNKSTLVLSNLAGPRNGYLYEGIRSKGFCAVVPGLGELAFGITAMSMCDRLYLTIFAEKNVIDDCSKIQELLEMNYESEVRNLKE
jgi:hypothetical protein